MTQKKTRKSRKKNPMADLLTKSLDSHNKKQLQSPSKALHKPERQEEVAQPAKLETPVREPAMVSQPRPSGQVFAKRRTGIQLSERDIEITRKITATLAMQGAEGVNTSRLLKLGLLLCEQADEVTLLDGFNEVLSSDGRMRR